jgi:serine/threonine-protein kinase
LARLTSAVPDERPRDALETRRLLLALRWPESHEPIARPVPAARPEAQERERLVAESEASFRDRWTGRRVRLVPLVARALERARAFAMSGDGSLEAILRVDSARGQIWVEELEGPSLASLGRGLRKEERAALERGLATLHEVGVAHGHVDAEHVRMTARFGPVLRFEPDAAPTATPDLDRLGLAELCERTG